MTLLGGRTPFGHQSLGTQIHAGLLGCRAVTWSVAELDWLGHDAETSASGIESQLKAGAIVFSGDSLLEVLDSSIKGRGPTLSATDLLLERMSAHYEFVTVPKVLESGSVRKVAWCLEPEAYLEEQLANAAESTATSMHSR